MFLTEIIFWNVFSIGPGWMKKEGKRRGARWWLLGFMLVQLANIHTSLVLGGGGRIPHERGFPSQLISHELFAWGEDYAGGTNYGAEMNVFTCKLPNNRGWLMEVTKRDKEDQDWSQVCRKVWKVKSWCKGEVWPHMGLGGGRDENICSTRNPSLKIDAT